MSKSIMAFISSKGDRSVGIIPNTTEVDTCFDAEMMSDKDFREGTRATLQDCFTMLWDDNIRVVFSDEIVDD